MPDDGGKPEGPGGQGMGGPGRPRKWKGGPKANELAEFLSNLGAREGLKTASFAARFPGSSTLWAEYLNGSKVIPAPVLGQVVQELCGTDGRLLEQTLLRAQKLHTAATAEAARPPAATQEPQVATRELIDVHRRLVDTSDRLIKATEFAESARATITTLLMMCARAETSVRELTTQRDRGQAMKRAETEARLDRARLRLEPTEAELERARQHRYTAEQAQQALIIEAEEARRELEELRRRAADLNHGADDTGSPEPPLPPARQEPIDPGPDEDFADFDDALERITNEGEDRERDLIGLTEHTGTPMPEHPASNPQIITGTVLPTPRPTPEPQVPKDSDPPRADTGSAPGGPPASAASAAHTPSNNDVLAPLRTLRIETEHTAHPSKTPLGPVRRSTSPALPGLSWTTPENPPTSRNRKRKPTSRNRKLKSFDPAPPSTGETDAVSALIWAWVCVALAVVLAYTVTATFTAGIQAHPGASIMNLIIYIVLALLALIVAAFLLATPILMKPKSDTPFFFSLIAVPLALPAGLLIPWLAAFNQPWQWLADHLGVI
ncbi:hypothetical protein [Streptomyces sp. NPDC002215]|uniref:hypothetical protein n=1 Tax=Streptomyces sp. NPDC002215 TaxID=3154412 RepID=UPI00331A3450